MILEEYDEELHLKTTYEEGISVGEERGLKRLSTLFQKLIQTQRIDDLKRASEDPDYQQKLFDEFHL